MPLVNLVKTVLPVKCHAVVVLMTANSLAYLAPLVLKVQLDEPAKTVHEVSKDPMVPLVLLVEIAIRLWLEALPENVAETDKLVLQVHQVHKAALVLKVHQVPKVITVETAMLVYPVIWVQEVIQVNPVLKVDPVLVLQVILSKDLPVPLVLQVKMVNPVLMVLKVSEESTVKTVRKVLKVDEAKLDLEVHQVFQVLMDDLALPVNAVNLSLVQKVLLVLMVTQVLTVNPVPLLFPFLQ